LTTNIRCRIDPECKFDLYGTAKKPAENLNKLQFSLADTVDAAAAKKMAKTQSANYPSKTEKDVVLAAWVLRNADCEKLNVSNVWATTKGNGVSVFMVANPIHVYGVDTKDIPKDFPPTEATLFLAVLVRIDGK